jgi:hypothetical protein
VLRAGTKYLAGRSAGMRGEPANCHPAFVLTGSGGINLHIGQPRVGTMNSAWRDCSIMSGRLSRSDAIVYE